MEGSQGMSNQLGWLTYDGEEESITQAERDYEIRRVNAAPEDDVFRQKHTHIATPAQYKVAFKEISRLIHPDKQEAEGRAEIANGAMKSKMSLETIKTRWTKHIRTQ